jgi:hypothetical protein
MKWDVKLRIIGVVVVGLIYYSYVRFNGGLEPLYLVLLTIIAIVAPDMIDKMPFGPAK